MLILTIVSFPLLIFSTFVFLMLIFIPYSLDVLSNLSIIAFLTLRYHRLVICKPQCLDPSSSDLFPLLQILYCFAYKLFYIDVNSSGESGHPCLTPLPTFPGSEYAPSILTRISCPMYRFPISLLSLQSIPIRLRACSSLLHSTLSNAFS